MKARAQQKATEVSGQLKSTVRDVTQGLSGKAGQLRGEVTDRQPAPGRPWPGTARLRWARGSPSPRPSPAVPPRPVPAPSRSRPGPGASAWAATPGPVQQQARRAAATVSQHRVPVAAAVAGGSLLLAGWLVAQGGRR